MGRSEGSGLWTWNPGPRKGPCPPLCQAQSCPPSVPNSRAEVGACLAQMKKLRFTKERGLSRTPSWVGPWFQSPRLHRTVSFPGHCVTSGKWTTLSGPGAACWMASGGSQPSLTGGEWAPIPVRCRGEGHVILEPALCAHAKQGA